MNFLSIIKLKANIKIRKHILNIILILFSPTNSLSVFLSQDLDKYIVKLQKQLFLTYNNKHSTTEEVNKFIA